MATDELGYALLSTDPTGGPTAWSKTANPIDIAGNESITRTELSHHHILRGGGFHRQGDRLDKLSIATATSATNSVLVVG